MRKRIALFFLLLIFLTGCLISLFPVINELLYREKMKTTVSEFQSNTEHQPPVIILPSGDAETTEYTPLPIRSYGRISNNTTGGCFKADRKA